MEIKSIRMTNICSKFNDICIDNYWYELPENWSVYKINFKCEIEGQSGSGKTYMVLFTGADKKGIREYVMSELNEKFNSVENKADASKVLKQIKKEFKDEVQYLAVNSHVDAGYALSML